MFFKLLVLLHLTQPTWTPTTSPLPLLKINPTPPGHSRSGCGWRSCKRTHSIPGGQRSDSKQYKSLCLQWCVDKIRSGRPGCWQSWNLDRSWPVNSFDANGHSVVGLRAKAPSSSSSLYANAFANVYVRSPRRAHLGSGFLYGLNWVWLGFRGDSPSLVFRILCVRQATPPYLLGLIHVIRWRVWQR